MILLREVKEEYWGNVILWRLAVALGEVQEGESEIRVDPDALLEMAEERLSIYKDSK